jgi:hypothetical protein
MAKHSIGELEDELKARDRRIEELREEVDGLRDLVRRLEEQDEDTDAVLESWKETFEMVQTESGGWTWEPFWDEHYQTIDDYNELVQQWNKYVPLINGKRQPVGRPLAASEAQCDEVLKLHKGGRSLRGIVEDTSLGLNTVRTIVSKGNGNDRTTKKHRQRFERIELDRTRLARRKRQKRTGDALPKRAQRVVEQGRALRKEAKGLGRG